MRIEDYRKCHERLANYLESLTSYSCVVCAKLVVCHEYEHYNAKYCGQYESWYGDWWAGGEPHFLAKLCKYDGDFYKLDKPYFIYCQGTDDGEFVKRDLILQEAQDLYDKIIDGTSKNQLMKMGIMPE